MVNTVLTVEDIVAKTPDLPTIPASALAAMREAESSTGTAVTVARYISQDQALASRVLRLANSAFYGLSRTVTTVPEAVVVLGMRCIKNLAMVASTYPWLSRPLKGYEIQPMDLWRHSFGVAVASQVVAERTRTNSDQAFAAGLLHNLGKVALSVWLEHRLHAAVLDGYGADMTFDQIERHVLGFDHCDVGAHMGQSWNLPTSIVNVLRYHHRPNEAPTPDPMIDCVHIADYLTMTLGIGIGLDGLRYNVYGEPFDRLNLSQEDVDVLADDVMEAYIKQQVLFEEI